MIIAYINYMLKKWGKKKLEIEKNYIFVDFWRAQFIILENEEKLYFVNCILKFFSSLFLFYEKKTQ